MITLRPYQRTAVDALFRYFERATGNPLLVMPTGSGKSLTLAVFLKEAIEAFPETRVLVLTHRKELIEQDAAAIRKAWPDAPVGIYSAGLGYRQIRQITVAGVQSVHKKAEQLGHVDLCVVDECHLVAHDGDGMYRRLLSDLRAKNDALKVIGLTATPYRLSGGLLTRGSSKIFTSVAHDVEVGPLVEQGYLAPLSSPATSAAYDTSAVSTVGGDFAIGELVGAVDRQTEITHAAMTEALALTADRRARLVFCVSIEHAECVARWLRDANQACEVITGDTDPLMRSSVIGRFRRGDLPWLVGVDVLTTGFDAPCCDAIVLLRPTQSTSLYVQIVGRGMRIADGKSDCIAEGSLVLTDHGEVPIENVTTNMKVWDGDGFVDHGGAILRGESEVVTYEGLTATVDHRAWTPFGWKTIKECIDNKIPLAITAEEGRPIRETDCYFTGDTPTRARHLPSCDVYGVWTVGMVSKGEPQIGCGRVSAMRESEDGSKMAANADDLCEAEMRESERQEIHGLRRARDTILVQDANRCVSLDHGEHRRIQGHADRSNRQQQGIRAGESPLVNKETKSCAHEENANLCEVPSIQGESSGNHVCGLNAEKAPGHNDVSRSDQEMAHAVEKAKRRVWDILNCGPLHRFTVSGRLVHNCIVLDYGGNVARHGPITAIRHATKQASASSTLKECPTCLAEVKISKRECPECGYKIGRAHV